MTSNVPTSKPADPYKAANEETGIPLKQKVEDLNTFMTMCKFGMMTTRDANSGHLMSRCMALAATVSPLTNSPDVCFMKLSKRRLTTSLAC